MKCQNCGKHEATIKYMQDINGVKDELYLCERCARDMNIDMNFNLDFDLGFNDVFSSLFGGESLIKPLEIEEGLVCDACGTSYDEFTANGMLGCENCYRIRGFGRNNIGYFERDPTPFGNLSSENRENRIVEGECGLASAYLSYTAAANRFAAVSEISYDLSG